ncbi:MAG: sugar phosphate nucleotidyltransferase, partial [Hungatella sp.]
MNRYALICRSILENPQVTQRELAHILEVSLGSINTLVKECITTQLIAQEEDGQYLLLEQGQELLKQYRVDGALIIAAGFGSRFVPLTFEMPKGLLEVFGERMIERQIKQLHEVGIYDITIVVGYLKEKFEYLIDKYEVKLLYNPEYSNKNTLTTIYHARDFLRGRNVYLLSSDNWMRENLFHAYECGAWYSAVHTDGDSSEWCLDFNKKGRIREVQVGGHNSWYMYGPVFFSKEWSETFLPVLEAYYRLPGTEPFYWEHVYMELLNGHAMRRLAEAGTAEVGGVPVRDLVPSRFDLYVNRQSETEVYEFENLEELRVFDPRYQTHSDNQALELIAEVFHVEEAEICDIQCLKAGMTNKSFLFRIRDRHYICRIPGPGTELLINRKQEQAVYEMVKPLDITEHILYFNGDTGYKIAEFYEGARNSDAGNPEDVTRCMQVLKQLHRAHLTIGHRFDMRERIGFYEKLCR